MWKLFAMVLVVSDSGSIATSQIATDFVSEQACRETAAQLFPPRSERDENGHRVVIRSATDCRFDGGPIGALPGPYFLNR